MDNDTADVVLALVKRAMQQEARYRAMLVTIGQLAKINGLDAAKVLSEMERRTKEAYEDLLSQTEDLDPFSAAFLDRDRSEFEPPPA